ncbi:HIT-like protein [Hyaloscypha hepaticicola]|uniref:HIT-like protein n=1 Tax=Hyaloscypha hepaticicola TaxID=2082293 RepID=A0A2J6Q236_9HELO|nr:HIT-like protein [Hyaloscypha hepaticicola]
MSAIRKLPALVRKQFEAAQASGDLTFFETRFQLRFSPALANKPKSQKPPNSKPIDPFENPPKGLFITDIPPSHFLVLNKFPVIPDHFILATKAFKQQTDVLEQDDLEAAYACLKAYRDNGEELFGFFNSGDASGASQPHRHIQFLPVESMRSGIQEGVKWDVLADSLIKNPRPALPFTYFSSPLPEDPSPETLHQIYNSLLEQACSLTKRTIKDDGENTGSEKTSPISYNLALTDRAMVLCPRMSEGLQINSGNGDLIGPISLNGTILGGTLLVKTEQEWDALIKNEEKLKDILQAIGVPSATNEKGGKL